MGGKPPPAPLFPPARAAISFQLLSIRMLLLCHPNVTLDRTKIVPPFLYSSPQQQQQRIWNQFWKSCFKAVPPLFPRSPTFNYYSISHTAIYSSRTWNFYPSRRSPFWREAAQPKARFGHGTFSLSEAAILARSGSAAAGGPFDRRSYFRTDAPRIKLSV